jgi:hypothetical protein
VTVGEEVELTEGFWRREGVASAKGEAVARGEELPIFSAFSGEEDSGKDNEYEKGDKEEEEEAGGE